MTSGKKTQNLKTEQSRCRIASPKQLLEYRNRGVQVVELYSGGQDANGTTGIVASCIAGNDVVRKGNGIASIGRSGRCLAVNDNVGAGNGGLSRIGTRVDVVDIAA